MGIKPRLSKTPCIGRSTSSVQYSPLLPCPLPPASGSDSALYLPYQNPNPERRSRRKYGEQLDYRNLPTKYLCSSNIDGHIKTDIYQIQLLHKEFACPVNVVIVLKTNLKTQALAHVILFSSDLELSYEQLIDYYKLRFQIEFNFRDAKQFWGLEDFMNLSQTAVTNAANLSFFMVNLSHHLLADFRLFNPLLSLWQKYN